MTIQERIVCTLSPLGVPVFQQGDWPGGELPDAFVTYYPVDSVDVSHFENNPTAFEWEIQINVYNSDPKELEPMRSCVDSLLRSSHWTRDGRGYGGTLNEPTQRFAWYMTYYFYEKEV